MLSVSIVLAGRGDVLAIFVNRGLRDTGRVMNAVYAPALFSQVLNRSYLRTGQRARFLWLECFVRGVFILMLISGLV